MSWRHFEGLPFFYFLYKNLFLSPYCRKCQYRQKCLIWYWQNRRNSQYCRKCSISPKFFWQQNTDGVDTIFTTLSWKMIWATEKYPYVATNIKYTFRELRTVSFNKKRVEKVIFIGKTDFVRLFQNCIYDSYTVLEQTRKIGFTDENMA